MSLWKEFAIEPDLFANYYLGNEILAGIGIEYGRIHRSAAQEMGPTRA
jgi:hypothetical protein